jgi:acyl-CoA thioester hydrolase
MERRHQPTRRLESSYPFTHELRSQFRDLDPLRHVNNVVVAAYYEDARTHFLRHQLGRSGGAAEQKMSWAGGPFHFLIANVEIDYLGVAHHPRAFRIGVGVSRIGSASVTISQALFQEGACIGLCDTTIVCMDADGVRALDDDQRAPLEAARAEFAPHDQPVS